MKLNQLEGALCDHYLVSLHNNPGSVHLIERAGQMKIEGGIDGNNLLQVAMSLAQQCVAASLHSNQTVLHNLRAASGIKFHRTAPLHPTAEEQFQTS
jgi:hypothetical protein